jgi:hypothetical protein
VPKLKEFKTNKTKEKKEMNTTTIQEPILEKDTICLFDVGCLVNLKIKMWSGRKMLTKTDLIELGYDPDKLPDDIVNLGRKLIVPKEELQVLAQIEKRARKALEKWSVPFGIASAHFIPSHMLPTVEGQIKDLKEEFFVRVDSFITRFDDLVATIRKAHPDFWDKCIKGNYPANPSELRKYFQFDWYTFKIAGINVIEETNVEDIIAQQKVQSEKQQEIRNQMQAEVGVFVGEYVSSMRKETIQFCDFMTARINGEPFGEEEDSKKLTAKTFSCFRTYVDRFKQMNIFGDDEIEKMLSEFKDTFLSPGTTNQDFDSEAIKTSVSKTLDAIREKADTEGSSGSKFIGELTRKVII